MNETKTDDLQNQLNAISFKKCEDIKVGDVLHYHINDNCNWKDGLRSVAYMLIKTACTSSYKFQCNGIPKTICLFSNSYRGRKDHLKAFKNVTCLTENSVDMVCDKYTVKLCRLRYAIFPLCWSKQMKEIVPEFGIRMKFVSVLFQAYMDYLTLQQEVRKQHWDIQYLLTYCDVIPVDCFFTQKFIRQGKTSVTLQHATYNVATNSWAYVGSKSNYFLSESISALHAAEKVGYKKKMIPVGSPHYVGQKQYQQPDRFKSDVIGIVMNSPERPVEENVNMITLLQKYCKATDRKIKLKFHPANDQKEYEKYIDHFITETYGSEISAQQFGNMVDVAIISASTVFTTMIRQWIPSFLFIRKDHDPMLYDDVEVFKFENEKELDEKLQNINSYLWIEAMKSARTFLLAQGDSISNYKNAFKRIGII